MEYGSIMRIMGIDYGEKRIGVAISDPLGITAQGLPTIERTNIQKDIQKILNIIREKEVIEIVRSEKRIGVAISDPLGITAQGLPTIERTNIQKDIQKILNIIREKEVIEIV